MKRILLLILLLLPSTPGLTATPLDGLYVGQRSIVRGSPATCPANGPASWRITDGKFAYRFWAGVIPVQVAGDGSLNGNIIYSPGHGAHNEATVAGTISGGSLEADAEWRACQLHFSLKKK